ncbi:hypothetical protein GCM10027188_08260 [Lysobacter humi (ex Lee et al. 2017)]
MQHSDRRGATDRWWAIYPAVPVLWLAAFALARVLEHAPHASLWFPPAAVTLASILILGARALPLVVICCALATVLSDRMYGGGASILTLALACAAFAFAHTTGFALAAWAIRRWGRVENGAPTIATVFGYLGATALGALFSAWFGSHLLATAGLIDEVPTMEFVTAWWLGDYVAAVTLMPVCAALLLALAGPGNAKAPQWMPGTSTAAARRPPILALVSFTVVTVGVLSIARLSEKQAILLALLVVPLLLQLWITYTAPRRYTIASVTLFSVLTVGASSFSPTSAALVLQCAALSLAANAYLGLSVPALIADNTRMREQLARDRLTGAMSRACFEDRSRAAVEVASASLQPLSIVLFDLNGLKAINDRLGHLVGDAVLVSAVKLCQGCLGADDALARLGGDEFVIVLPGCDEERALDVVETLRSALATLEIEGVRGTVSASFGVASWVRGDTGEAMLARADAAMYVDKRAARGRASRHPVEDGAPGDPSGTCD